MAAARALTRSVLFAGASAVVILAAVHLTRAPIDISPRVVDSAPLDLLNPSLVQGGAGPAIVATETLARPVFSPSRRPDTPIAPTVPQPAATPAPQSMQFTLAGVFIGDGVRRALIASPASPQGDWLDVGADLGGWRLERIEADSVEIASATDSVTLQLYVDNAPPH